MPPPSSGFACIASLTLLTLSCSEPSRQAGSATSPASSTTDSEAMPEATADAAAAEAPSTDAAAASTASAATPSGKKPGTVPPGGKCTREVWQPAAKEFEGGTDCAAMPAYATPDRPTGSQCVMESGPGAYCTHACKTNADCKDLVREGFRGECSATMCLLGK